MLLGGPSWLTGMHSPYPVPGAGHQVGWPRLSQACSKAQPEASDTDNHFLSTTLRSWATTKCGNLVCSGLNAFYLKRKEIQDSCLLYVGDGPLLCFFWTGETRTGAPPPKKNKKSTDPISSVQLLSRAVCVPLAPITFVLV